MTVKERAFTADEVDDIETWLPYWIENGSMPASAGKMVREMLLTIRGLQAALAAERERANTGEAIVSALEQYSARLAEEMRDRAFAATAGDTPTPEGDTDATR